LITSSVALVAPPWPLFNRPSIQIGVLKPYLERHVGVKVRGFHPYLYLASRLGFKQYHRISLSSWSSEAVASSLLFPEKTRECESVFIKELGRKSDIGTDKSLSFSVVSQCMNDTMTHFSTSIDWSSFLMVGFTVCLNQLSSSLFLSRLIKEKFPGTPIVFGGPGCAGDMGKGILDVFPWVDYIIIGEGELPLRDLIRHLLGQGDFPERGVISRDNAVDELPSAMQIRDLNELPFPNFDDYYRELGQAKANFYPVLPVEGSRGCWWSRCRFCNLNLQWHGYRAKDARHISSEIDYLSRRYKALDFAFMDNALPRRSAARIFELIATHKRHYKFFCELRAVHNRDEFRCMASGGLRDLQVGIEALSPDLLSLIRKGVGVIDNIAAMKHSHETGIRLDGNLILHFPKATEDHVKDTLAMLDLVWPFPPLKTVSFWLGLDSPLFKDASSFGIKGISAHPYYYSLFPRDLVNRLTFTMLSYRGDRGFQRRIWKPVELKVKKWQYNYKKLSGLAPFLSYRDGGDFIHIRQVLPDGRVLHHRLYGASRQIYLSALSPVRVEKLLPLVPENNVKALDDFIKKMQDKRLMYREKDKVISLAIESL